MHATQANHGVKRHNTTLGKLTALGLALALVLTGCQRNTDTPSDATTDSARPNTTAPVLANAASAPKPIDAVPVGEPLQPPASAVPILPTPQAPAPASVEIAPNQNTDRYTSTTPSPVTTPSSVTPVVVPQAASASTATATPKAEPAANAKPTAPTKQDLLRADLTKLFHTINEFDHESQAKQAEIGQKMQAAKTPQEQAKLFKQIVNQMTQQKNTLAKLQFNDPRVTQVRDMMVESVNQSIAGTQAMIKNPTATPETHPEIVEHMQKSQNIAVKARDRLMKLTQEAEGDAAPKTSKTKHK